MKKKLITFFINTLVISGCTFLVLPYAWAQESAFDQVTYKCGNETSIRVTIDENNQPVSAECITSPASGSHVIPAFIYTNKTYLHVEVDNVPVIPGFHITNGGPPPGNAVCTNTLPLFIYSNKLFRCYVR